MSFRERRWWHQIISHILLTADVPSCQPQRDARVAAEFAETSPSISPDGRWLAYASNETGIREVGPQTVPQLRRIQRRSPYHLNQESRENDNILPIMLA